MGTHEWRWWEEFEKTEPHRDQSRRNATIIRWAVTGGWSILALFKLLAGAWVFALVYAVFAVGFFVAYSFGFRRQQRRRGPEG